MNYTQVYGRGNTVSVKNEGHMWATLHVSLQEMQYCVKTGKFWSVKKFSELFTQMAAAKPDEE